jgi:hypothetical protein
MDLSYHIQAFLGGLARSVSDDLELMLFAFLAAAIGLYVTLGRNRGAGR